TLGRVIINKLFAAEKLEINDEILAKILPKFNKKSISDLCVSVAEGVISRNEVLRAAYPQHKKSVKTKIGIEKVKSRSKHSIPIDGLIPGMAIHFATCCHPIPGD